MSRCCIRARPADCLPRNTVYNNSIHSGSARTSSGGFAARVAGKPLADMLTLLSSQGIPLTGEDKAGADDVREEMRKARDWLAKPAA